MNKLMSFFSNLNQKPDTLLIVGLGNPGRDYKDNRHNIGFMVVDEVAVRLGMEFSRMQNNAMVTRGEFSGKKLILAKPRTYMNESGRAVSALMRFYKIPTSNLLVIFDDVDLPFESIRIRADGGSSGHKGMNSIIQHLGTQEFPRLRVGIDRPPGRMETPDYVLQDFSSTQREMLPFVLDLSARAAMAFVEIGILQAMNEYNTSQP